MPEVKTVDILEGQRNALLAPANGRQALYSERVMEPLRPVWEHIMSFMPAGVDPGSGEGGDPALSAARLIGLYDPDSDAGEGLDALAELAKRDSFAGCVRAQESALEVLSPQEHGVNFEGVTFALALADPRTPDLMERHAGYMGGASFSDWILAYVWPTDYNLPRLPALAVHELHHKVRLAFEPWGETTTVGQYLVLEGLAEAFAAERFGEELLGPWTKALTEDELGAARPVVRDALEVSGFDEIRGYIFGDWAAPQDCLTTDRSTWGPSITRTRTPAKHRRWRPVPRCRKRYSSLTWPSAARYRKPRTANASDKHNYRKHRSGSRASGTEPARGGLSEPRHNMWDPRRDLCWPLLWLGYWDGSRP